MPPLRDDKLPADAGPDEARAYILAHDFQVGHCNRMSDRQLKLLYNAALHLRGMELLSGMDGWSHDELVNAIVALTFPDVARASEIWYRHVQMPAIGQE